MEQQTKYTIPLGPYNAAGLRLQISAALETRTELLSRAKYPGMWKMTDRMSGASARREAYRPAQVTSGLLYLAAAAVMLVPGIQRMQTSMILVGVFALGYGVWKLLQRPGKPRRETSFDRAAAELLERASAAGGEAVFDGEGMTLPMGGDATTRVPYGEMECAVETADAILAVYDGRAVILPKAGVPDTFFSFLEEKVAVYRILPGARAEE